MCPATASDVFVEKRLERAVQHVSDYWFPVNPVLLKEIQIGLHSGRYGDNERQLVREIKSDLSLFVFCVRGLVTLLREEGDVVPEGTSPVALLESAGLRRLKQILEIEDREISAHALDQSSDVQLARVQEIMVSASTAEILSQSYQLDRDYAFSAAVLRQLGHALIAWNYPEIYESSFQELGEGEQLDRVLTRRLGFSPIMLAMRLMQRWGFSRGNCEDLGVYESEGFEEAEIISSIGASVVQLCRIGETLARANDPKHYPSARDDWAIARSAISEHLGEEGLQAVREHFEEKCESYLTVVPHLFRAGVALDPNLMFERHPDDDLKQRNPYIGLCDRRVREGLDELYAYLRESADIRANVRLFVRKTVPWGGFSGGCIYTMDTGLMMLVPQITLGALKLRENAEVDYSLVSSGNDVVAVAYQSVDPVVEYSSSEEGESYLAIAGVFGTTQRYGVLYLEVPSDLSCESESQHMLHFKALRHALNDSLDLKF